MKLKTSVLKYNSIMRQLRLLTKEVLTRREELVNSPYVSCFNEYYQHVKFPDPRIRGNLIVAAISIGLECQLFDWEEECAGDDDEDHKSLVANEFRGFLDEVISIDTRTLKWSNRLYSVHFIHTPDVIYLKMPQDLY